MPKIVMPKIVMPKIVMPEIQDKMQKSEPQAFKHMFGKALLIRMAEALANEYAAFDPQSFIALTPALADLEMKARVQLIRDEIRRQLPEDYGKALQIILKATRRRTLKGFDLWPFLEFVQTFGLGDLTGSLAALKELTPLFTAEFAVRPFLQQHTTATLLFLEKCALDEDVHLRRWASEGTRPRLPWGERLQSFVREPSLALGILESLKFDPELYVRKSVSNHLNDIAKDHPTWVLKLLADWKKSAACHHEEKITWIINRALRTLIKAGDPRALKLIGVSPKAQIKITGFKINKKVFTLGERIEFAFRIKSLDRKPQKIVVDYIIHFVKANQTRNPKVFKLKMAVLAADGELVIAKRHHLKEVTTRVHYPGVHLLEIQVNGAVVKRIPWKLLSAGSY